MNLLYKMRIIYSNKYKREDLLRVVRINIAYTINALKKLSTKSSVLSKRILQEE